MFGLGTTTTTLKVQGMTCGHCEMNVTRHLKEVAGVKEVKASAKDGNVEVKHDGKVDVSKMAEAVAAAGYKVVE